MRSQFADRVVALGSTADVEDVVAGPAVDAPAAEVGLDVIAARPGVDDVGAMACVDEVPAGAAVDAVELARGLPGRLVVAPQHVAPRAGVERVVAVAAEQLVVA